MCENRALGSAERESKLSSTRVISGSAGTLTTFAGERELSIRYHGGRERSEKLRGGRAKRDESTRVQGIDKEHFDMIYLQASLSEKRGKRGRGGGGYIRKRMGHEGSRAGRALAGKFPAIPVVPPVANSRARHSDLTPPRRLASTPFWSHPNVSEFTLKGCQSGWPESVRLARSLRDRHRRRRREKRIQGRAGRRGCCGGGREEYSSSGALR